MSLLLTNQVFTFGRIQCQMASTNAIVNDIDVTLQATLVLRAADRFRGGREGLINTIMECSVGE